MDLSFNEAQERSRRLDDMLRKQTSELINEHRQSPSLTSRSLLRTARSLNSAQSRSPPPYFSKNAWGMDGMKVKSSQ